jgi:hypothetical protein
LCKTCAACHRWSPAWHAVVDRAAGTVHLNLTSNPGNGCQACRLLVDTTNRFVASGCSVWVEADFT